MNNPFYYTPSPECLKASRELIDWLSGKPSFFCDHPVDPAFRAEIDKGKMFGVLVVEGCSYIAAYSGQVCGRSDWPEFAPAVFDYLQPDGYFKQHEAEITTINHQIADLSNNPNGSNAQSPEVHGESLGSNADHRPIFDKAKHEGETDEEYVKRRQWENAELHRWKLRQREREAKVKDEAKQKAEKLQSLKTLRKRKSDDLQRWLFHHFQMRNALGDTQDLLQITKWYQATSRSSCHSKGIASSLPLGEGQGGASSLLSKEGRGGSSIPPAGSGECCEPKLLQYAFTHGLKPVSMAMFWWGESPKGEVRHHLQFYPACNSKCKPILKWMLQGIDVDPNPLEDKEQDKMLASQLKTLYEDEAICVVSKPAGLLSVPGKSGRESVYSIMRRRYPDTDSPLIVHRLDMSTSGIMIIAKTMDAYHNLQRQFASHEVKKRYVAVLEHGSFGNQHPSPLGRAWERPKGWESPKGSLSLPLRPDIDDRPRQVVDFEYGKPAVTVYQFVGKDRVWLWPQTGRTHQLRVHCAHRLGLNNPIKGDELYGTRADRLYLHAAEITFRHPLTGRMMTIKDNPPF